MIAMTLTAIAEVVGGEIAGDGSTVVTGGAYVDSRTPIADGLFVAIAGEHVDGHLYADHAHAVLGSRSTSRPTVVVEDPVAALGKLARHVIDHTDATVIAMTGSQGKTGTKDYLAGILAAQAPTVATRGNHNNEIGVPLTVLEAQPDTRYLVVEMGARGIGHIAYLCAIAPPHAAAVLNVGSAHVGEFGSRENIAVAKGEIVEALSAKGHAVLNADDEFCAAMGERTAAEVLWFGAEADVSWRDVSYDALGRPSFALTYAGASEPVTLSQPGAHQVTNAAAAAALALAVGLRLDQIAPALSAALPASRWRMELHERADGLVVINDAYNANPESMRSAIATLGQIGATQERRTIAVLGVMLELGDAHDSGHEAVGRAVADAAVDVLLIVGDEAVAMATGAQSGTTPVTEIIRTAGRDDAIAWLGKNAVAGDVVLVKASRGAALDVVADALLAADSGEGAHDT